MDELRCKREELPAYLYRVMYWPSQTRYSTASGLEAQDTQKFASHEPFDPDEFRDMVLNHIDWNSGGKSPFISLLPGPCGAVDWGRTLRPYKTWDLIEIQTAKLLSEGVHLFKLVDVSDKLGIALPAKKSSYLRFEYLCLHRVPWEAIIQRLPNTIIPSSDIAPCNVMCYPLSQTYLKPSRKNEKRTQFLDDLITNISTLLYV
ncbi:hypothetical protein V8F06_013244 [Rhypophila decipiens]